jgi:hypothetical protein
LGVLGKLANLARGWVSGTTRSTGNAPRSLRCVAYIRHVREKRLLRTSHAQMYESKGSEAWYTLPWLHASARAYAHMSCVWVHAAATTFIKRSRIWLFSFSKWRHRRGCIRTSSSFGTSQASNRKAAKDTSSGSRDFACRNAAGDEHMKARCYGCFEQI